MRLDDSPASQKKNILDTAAAEQLCYKNLMLRVVLGGILTEAAGGRCEHAPSGVFSRLMLLRNGAKQASDFLFGLDTKISSS